MHKYYFVRMSFNRALSLTFRHSFYLRLSMFAVDDEHIGLEEHKDDLKKTVHGQLRVDLSSALSPSQIDTDVLFSSATQAAIELSPSNSIYGNNTGISSVLNDHSLTDLSMATNSSPVSAVTGNTIQDGYYSLLHKAQAVASQYERMYWTQSTAHLFKTKHFNPKNYIIAAGFLQKAKRTLAAKSSSSVNAVRFKKWSPRYVVLTSTMLYVYRADATGTHNGLIMPVGEAEIVGELTNCIELSQMVDVQAVNHTATSFQNITLRPGYYIFLKTKQKTTLFRASSLLEARLWVSAIVKLVPELKVLVPFTNVRKIIARLSNPSRELLMSPLLLHGARCRDIIAIAYMNKERDGVVRVGW